MLRTSRNSLCFGGGFPSQLFFLSDGKGLSLHKAVAGDSTNKYRKTSPGAAIVLGTMTGLKAIFNQLRLETERNVVRLHPPPERSPDLLQPSAVCCRIEGAFLCQSPGCFRGEGNLACVGRSTKFGAEKLWALVL